MRTNHRIVGAAGALLLLAACRSTGEPEPEATFDFQFRGGDFGWQAGFTDYPEGREADVGFVGDHRPLPPPITSDGPALYQRGTNISDDLFLYFKKRVEGLEPGARYRVSFRIDFASNVGRDCAFGLGASVFLKAGASRLEPVEFVDGSGDVRITLDKGEQQNRGSEAILMGDVRNGQPGCDEDVPYAVVSRIGAGESVTLTADEHGAAWLVLGSESAFEGPHELFFTRFRATFRRIS